MKVALYVWNVCRDVALGKYAFEDIDLIISPTVMKNEMEAQEHCDNLTQTWFYNLLTEAQLLELQKENFPTEKYKKYTTQNCEKAQEIFWKYWNSGKIFQPRLLVGMCIISFECEGFFDSIEEYITYLEEKVNSLIIYHKEEVNQKGLIDALRSL